MGSNEQHNERLIKLLERRRAIDLQPNKDKYKIGLTEIPYIGHLLSEQGVKPDLSKFDAIINMSGHTNKQDLQRFMEMLAYLSQFIPNMAEEPAPLRRLLEKNVQWHWSDEHQKSLDSIKTLLTKAQGAENLVGWVEMKVHIMDEAKEEAGGDSKGGGTRTDNRRNNRGFNTGKRARGCVVDNCREDHPPWVCEAFKRLPVTKRKELIAKSGRYFRCLASGHHRRRCSRTVPCGIDGCKSVTHSRYLHQSNRNPTDNESNNSNPLNGAEQPNENENATSSTFTTNQIDKVSLMVLPGLISNPNQKKKVNVNIMLDPCSTGSYISEHAAEELKLQGRTQHLTVTGTGGTEVQKMSRRVNLNVSNIKGNFSATVEANVLDDITGTTPAIEWSDLKENWPQLQKVPFERVANRRQIGLLIGSDHPFSTMFFKRYMDHKPTTQLLGLQTLDGFVLDRHRQLESTITRVYMSHAPIDPAWLEQIPKNQQTIFFDNFGSWSQWELNTRTLQC